MKKPGIYLLVICCAFLIFTGGFFLGRNANRSVVTVSQSPDPPASVPTSPDTPNAPTHGLPININTATSEQLQTLPNIGPVLAQRIIHYRETHGLFADPAELANVEGIGITRLQDILDYITTGG